MLNDEVTQLISKYRTSALGWKLSGAGGGGYLILVSDEPIENAVCVTARRDGNSG
jgi:galactokinase/mevalonate kinase-like predicted kinase